jgi:predicted ester cyclase
MARLLAVQLLLVLADADVARDSVDSRDPLGKRIVKAMDATISNHVAWNNFTEWNAVQEQFFTKDMMYNTVDGFPKNGQLKGLRDWFDGEHMPWNNAFWPVTFNQMIFLGEEFSGSTTTYANAEWIGPLGQLSPGLAIGRNAMVRICDFYHLIPDSTSKFGVRIKENWMMIDMVDLMMQAGRRVLPKAALPEGWVQPPKAVDGTPAPNSYFVNPAHTDVSRAVVSRLLQHEWAQKSGVSPSWAEDMIWYGPAGIGMARSKEEYRKEFIEKLYRAFANVKLEISVMPCEGPYCGAHGYLHGDHVGEWLGQPATGKRVSLRFGSHWHVVNGQVIEGWTLMDLPNLFRQFGIDLFSRDQPIDMVLPSPPKPIQFNNDCLIEYHLNPPTKNAPQDFLEECPKWVIQTTDAVWHSHNRINESIDEYFYSDWASYSDAGTARGLPALKAAVYAKRAAFPDLRIHITDVTCHGNDIDGYKTTMPDILTGTNTGPSEFGPATNRSVIYRGLAVSYVQKVQGRWQYIAEWVLHDSGTATLQLGYTPQMAPKPEYRFCAQNTPSWGWKPPMNYSTEPSPMLIM